MSLDQGIEQYLLRLTEDLPGPMEEPALSTGQDPLQEAHLKDKANVKTLREECPEVFALTRNSFPSEPPTGRKLELVRQQMMRIHRSSGHASCQNL